MVMAKEDMTYFKMAFDSLNKGQDSLNNKMDTAISQLARQDEHLKNLNSKIATQEVFNATTNARFADVYNEFQKRRDDAAKDKECVDNKIINLDKKMMEEGFEKDKGFLKIEYKIAIISGIIILLVNFGPEVASKLLAFL